MADIEAIPTPDGPPTPAPTTPAATPAPEKTFTQAELEQHIADRLKRERDKYKDYPDLKAAADELAKIKESQLSETEKLQKRLAELEQARAAAETQARETLIKSAIVAAAARLNFVDPEDAYSLVNKAAVEFENGQPANVEKLVKDLAESRKYLIKSSNPALATFNPSGNGGPVAETDAQKRARIYGGGGSIFDANRAEQRGGGVFWPKGKPEQ